MNRREFHQTLGAALALPYAGGLTGSAQQQQQPTHPQQQHQPQHGGDLHSSVPSGPPQQIAMLIFPEMTALDLIGPYTFLAGLMNVNVHLVWKTKEVFGADRGIPMAATHTLDECARDLDILFVPGGMRGVIAVMRDRDVLDFLADRGSRAKYVTSVCTGALILGCAGLLRGYRATTHWASHDILPTLGAIPVKARVVEDRNRITGGGVTSGIDFGLRIAARLRDERFAKMLQLVNEYDPHPPFDAGSPTSAGPEITDHIRQLMKPGLDDARKAAAAAAHGWQA
jgi:cyclohexyl-isocyanide hydratase